MCVETAWCGPQRSEDTGPLEQWRAERLLIDLVSDYCWGGQRQIGSDRLELSGGLAVSFQLDTRNARISTFLIN